MKPTPVMNIKRTILAILVAIMLPASVLQAQSSQLVAADRLYNKMAYAHAIPLYEKGLKKFIEPGAAERLGDCYMEIGDSKMAEAWYGKLSRMSNPKPSVILKYAQTLKFNGKYSDAKTWFDEYGAKGGDPNVAAKLARSCEQAPKFRQDSARYRIMEMEFNSAQSDIVAVPYQSGVVFTSARTRGGFSKLVNARNNNRFYDVYYTEPVAGKGYSRPKHLHGNIHSRFHDGPIAFTKTGDKLYFTRSNYYNGKLRKSSEGRTHLTILSAVQSGKKWKIAEYLPFNDDHYSCGHPTLSLEGDYMVFASDMPGGYGRSDLYVTRWENGKWGKPQNLGPEINTEGDEFFPELARDGALYFSSNGHVGLGGLDIFRAENQNGKWSGVENVGYPLNSSSDDFGLIWMGKTNKGYFTSNRPGGSGQDDIYWFEAFSTLKFKVVDSKTGDPLSNAQVQVIFGTKTQDLTTDQDGFCKYFFKPGGTVFVTANREEYKEYKEKIATDDIPNGSERVQTVQMDRDLEYLLGGAVTDQGTGQPLEGTNIELFGEIDTTRYVTNEQGRFSAELQPGSDYFILMEKDNYIPKVEDVTTRDVESPAEFDVNAKLKAGDYYLVDGLVFKNDNNAPLKGINIYAISTENQQKIFSYATRRDGKFLIVLDKAAAKGFYLVASGAGFFSNRVDVVPKDSASKNISVKIPMSEYGVDQIVKTIYYDYNKSDLRFLSQKDLNEIVYFLVENPEASVELSSHTDSRGGNTYNKNLSQSRADAARQFIIEKGIDENRIVSKGYGESNLLNKCKDGVNCSEDEHQINRRTEVKVIGLDMDKAKANSPNGKKSIEGKDKKPIRDEKKSIKE